MSKLESIVPPLELCKRIPADDKLFQQTALAWVLLGKDWPTVLERERLPKDRTGFEVIPAPTLAEIMQEIPLDVMLTRRYGYSEDYGWGEWDDRDYVEMFHNPAEAALRLWLKLNGMEVEHDQR